MDKLAKLRLESQRVSFKDEWGIEFTCAYESTYPAWEIAANLNTPFGLLPPGCLKRAIYRSTPLNQRYFLRDIGIEDVAMLASEIWCSQFESKMKEALSEMLLETRALTLRELAKRFPIKAPSIDSKNLFNALFKVSNENRRRRLNVPLHGGARRERKDFRTSNILILYAYHVTILKRYWKDVTVFFEENDYSAECLDKFKKTKLFKILSRSFPLPPGELEGLLKKVFIRKREKKPEYQPLGFALKHANAILNIPSYDKYNTLRACYQEGLKEARKYRRYYKDILLDEIFKNKPTQKKNKK